MSTNQTKQASPHTKMKGSKLGEVVWTSGFWARYFELCKDSIIPSTWEAMNNPINAAVFSNFYVAAGLQEGQHIGKDWSDGDCYKWMESLSYVYSVTGDKEILDRLDDLIAVIAQAQESDGYISTQVQLKPEKKRWTRLRDHELYNMGHLMTSASVHYQATGKTNFLDIATKLADYLYTVFAHRPPELAHFAYNPSNIMGLIDLYRVTHEQNYLELAGIFVDMRGSQSEPLAKGPVQHSQRIDFGNQNQDHVPLREEEHAVGHAVLAMYLYCGAADVYAETGDTSLLEALDRIWHDVVNSKMYITGGVGAYHKGISIRGDQVHEAFGDAYELPNTTAYNETCANIGHAMFSWRLLNITGDGKYGDVMEKVIYNSGLSPVSIDGKHFFYTNLLRFHGHDHNLLSNDESERWHTYTCYCCPTQVARSTAWMNNWAYSFSENSVWVNMYSGSKLEKTLPDGSNLKLEMETDYPWDGRVNLTINDAPETPYTIRLRIPEWAGGTTVKINGENFKDKVTAGDYLQLGRVWKQGDRVEINFPMDARLVKSHPNVVENKNHVAVMRGPVVYCIESADLPEGIEVSEIHLSDDSQITSRFADDTLGGVTVLEMDAIRVASDVGDSLYSSYVTPTKEKVSIKMIPYFAWANRGVNQMAVWIPQLV